MPLSARVIMQAMRYHIWTAGCQMNVADSQRVASELERLGYRPVRHPEDADVIVLGGGPAGGGAGHGRRGRHVGRGR